MKTHGNYRENTNGMSRELVEGRREVGENLVHALWQHNLQYTQAHTVSCWCGRALLQTGQHVCEDAVPISHCVLIRFMLSQAGKRTQAVLHDRFAPPLKHQSKRYYALGTHVHCMHSTHTSTCTRAAVISAVHMQHTHAHAYPQHQHAGSSVFVEYY